MPAGTCIAIGLHLKNVGVYVIWHSDRVLREPKLLADGIVGLIKRRCGPLAKRYLGVKLNREMITGRYVWPLRKSKKKLLMTEIGAIVRGQILRVQDLFSRHRIDL